MHLTRRHFLHTSGALATYLGLGRVLGPLGTSIGDETGGLPAVRRGKTLVVVFLRGGADGLNLVVPHGDPHYRQLRQRVAVPAPGGNGTAIDLDGFFGLHPRMGSLAPLFRSGQAIAAHAVGYDHNTRSHFEEQDVWETGIVGNTVNSDGWVNRHLATSEGHGPLRAVAVGSTLPRIMRGDVPAFAIRGLDDLGVPIQRAEDGSIIRAALERAHAPVDAGERDAALELVSDSARGTLEALTALRRVRQLEPSGARYPNTELARQLGLVARLIRADVGLEVAEVELGGWDTHRDQGGGGGGQFGNLAEQLGGALAAFAADLGEKMDDVMVVTLTDFGRTAAENGTGGTDHGWANAMFLLGGPVAAAGHERPVVGTWPGLGPEQLHQGRDLLHTTDFRDVLAELVRVHLGNERLETVLPNHAFTRHGLIA